jgi:hypothetical protein
VVTHTCKEDRVMANTATKHHEKGCSCCGTHQHVWYTTLALMSTVILTPFDLWSRPVMQTLSSDACQTQLYLECENCFITHQLGRRIYRLQRCTKVLQTAAPIQKDSSAGAARRDYVGHAALWRKPAQTNPKSAALSALLPVASVVVAVYRRGLLGCTTVATDQETIRRPVSALVFV